MEQEWFRNLPLGEFIRGNPTSEEIENYSAGRAREIKGELEVIADDINSQITARRAKFKGGESTEREYTGWLRAARRVKSGATKTLEIIKPIAHLEHQSQHEYRSLQKRDARRQKLIESHERINQDRKAIRSLALDLIELLNEVGEMDPQVKDHISKSEAFQKSDEILWKKAEQSNESQSE